VLFYCKYFLLLYKSTCNGPSIGLTKLYIMYVQNYTLKIDKALSLFVSPWCDFVNISTPFNSVFNIYSFATFLNLKVNI
jgi:hypothetical protein